MKYIYIGNIVNTHGIKGEIRIISDFKYKDEIFKKGFKIYIGKEKTEKIINTYRVHKMFDMVTLNGINNINDVLKYKQEKVYINKEDLKIDDILDEELIGLEVYMNDKNIGIVTKLEKTPMYKILVVMKNGKRNLIPNIKNFIKNIDIENKKITIKYMEGLINEN